MKVVKNPNVAWKRPAKVTMETWFTKDSRKVHLPDLRKAREKAETAYRTHLEQRGYSVHKTLSEGTYSYEWDA